ncbi:aldehyde dehydrogenase [Spongiactinospora rosea]|uniref:Aldehyde dehydrogenase n=1 Tax=Spongiactinospora rosea TaxID=2248750 RepID=A0A366LXK0_9ACTN|nr:aldehyde dehydrogenase family protein [Spongiactinospora rosea]RBQ18290.1 aldehyde dehydrogenase [Spongiactinospora rosea]
MTATHIGSEAGLYIAGSWRRGGGPAIPVINPATEDVIATVPSATPEEVEEALAAAQRAQREWGRAPGGVRGALVRAIGDVIRANATELAELQTAEVGKPLAISHAEIAMAAQLADYTAGWDRRIEGEILPSDNADEVIHLNRVPIGVVAAVTAWNAPVALLVRKIAPALVAGNAVVVKPSELAPLSSIALVRMIAEAVDLPPGLLNLVTGGPETGLALVTSPRTGLVTLTGHRDTGKKVMAAAAANLTRVSLELGGKAPAIVWADADLDSAVPAVAMARHFNGGQVCTSAERVFVHESVFEEFVARYTALVGHLRVGDPLTEVELGPLAGAAQRDKSIGAIERAKAEGARVVLGGGRPDGDAFERGFWVAPTVLVDVEPGMHIMREEVFGPVTPIAKVDTLERAFELANETRYGLSAYLYTADHRIAMRAERDLDFGELYVNRSIGEQAQGHHSGHRESGLGGEDGKHGVLRYTQLRSVYHNYA